LKEYLKLIIAPLIMLQLNQGEHGIRNNYQVQII
jgi:hypothetical protein